MDDIGNNRKNFRTSFERSYDARSLYRRLQRPPSATPRTNSAADRSGASGLLPDYRQNRSNGDINQIRDNLRPVTSLASHNPVTTKPPTIEPSPRSHRRSLKPLVIGMGCLLAVSGLGAGGYFVYSSKFKATGSKSAVLSAVVNDPTVVESMYFPGKLPVGYTKSLVSASRPEDAKGVYIITMKHQTDPNKSIFISQQTLPKELDVDQFNKSLQDNVTFQTVAGKATAGTIPADALHVVSIISQEQWIIINAPDAVRLDDLKLVANGLTR